MNNPLFLWDKYLAIIDPKGNQAFTFNVEPFQDYPIPNYGNLVNEFHCSLQNYGFSE